MNQIGLRNPKIGLPDLTWAYCEPGDWVQGFHSGQLWLAYQMTGDVRFREAARARRPDFRYVLEHRAMRDHDLGFQFSLHSVADWLMTADWQARQMALEAANALVGRYRAEGGYIQAWSARETGDRDRAVFVNGRMIADTMQNLALLYWAHRETAIEDFRTVAENHAETTRQHLVRSDGSSFHTFIFDPSTGEPIRGETHQGRADDSCWSRGQAWLLHGFAQCYVATGNRAHLETAEHIAGRTEELLAGASVPPWDFSAADDQPTFIDSSAGAVMAAGLQILALVTEPESAERWRALGDHLLDGLLEQCDLTNHPTAQGLLSGGAAHVNVGKADTMLPYGDYYFMEALMRAQGHSRFFW